jgi:hypothetical protein
LTTKSRNGIIKTVKEREEHNMRHYWIILLNDGTYKELVGTENYVKEWMSTHYPHQGYRKIIWDD